MHKLWTLPAAGLLLALTACGGGSGGGDTGAATPAAGSDPGGASASVASGSGGGTPSSVDVCQVLPTSDVNRITGGSYTKTKSSSVAGQIFDCEYTDAGFGLLQISVAVVNGALDYQSDTQAMSSLEKPIPVSGVGDKAFTVADPKGNAGSAGVAAFASYGALFGDQYVKIGGSYVTPEQGKQIVEEIHGKL